MTAVALIVGCLAILGLTQVTRQALRRPSIVVHRPVPQASRRYR